MIGDEERTLESQVVQQIAQVFGVGRVSFYDAAENRVYATGTPPISEEILRRVAEPHTAEVIVDQRTRVVPVQLGGRHFGSLGVSGGTLSDAALQAITQLAAISIERAREQKAAAHAEAERESEQLKSALLDALAHEFKTPLTSIKAAGTTVLARAAIGSIDRELLTIIDEETDHMTNMVSEAIELARVPGAELKLEREPVPARLLISSVLESLRTANDGRAIEIEIPEDIPPLFVDRRRSELVFRQLIDNAMKYANPLSRIRISAKMSSGSIEFEIASAGQMIPRGELDLIFRKFYRGAGVRDRIPGTGMGLPIAKAIVEAHGGELRVHSAPDGKTSFFFTLPVVARAAQGGKTV
jgi:two-component system sensor histidine kinase KdpD